jgi:phosphoglycerate dehydrogenase-like enzyme
VAPRFRVALSWDFVGPHGELIWGEDLGLGHLDAASELVDYHVMAGSDREIKAEQIADCDGLILLAPRVTPRTFERGADRLVVIGRHGVGYDSVDVAACTANDVALFITPQTSRHPVAASALTFILALSRRALEKDRIVRQGRWTERHQFIGHEIQGRTLGIIGLGNIGRELVRLVAPFAMRVIAYDPNVEQESAPPGVILASLEQLLQESDFVSIHCLLTERTHHLLNDTTLRLMKPGAYLINLARGPIVDQAALTRVLVERRIAGAALDVFDPEPIQSDDPLLRLDNVLFSPHTAAVSFEGFRDATVADCLGILEAARGHLPENVVNREVVERPGFQQKLARFLR